jgi:hypothetical protein
MVSGSAFGFGSWMWRQRGQWRGGNRHIDAGFPTGGRASLGGQYSVDYGASGGMQAIIAPEYGVIVPTATGGSEVP